MNVFQIAWKSIRQRLLASSLTSLSVALGVMLMVVVLVIYQVIGSALEARSVAYDLVVGKQGGSIDLVMSSVYRVGTPPAPVPYRFYLALKHCPDVFFDNIPPAEATVPIAMGDTTEIGGFPIIGTTSDYFLQGYGHQQEFRFVENSRSFSESFDAIIGSEVAATNGWTVGDPENNIPATQFKMIHGSADGSFEPHVHEEKFTVVAVLRPTGTANDRTVFVQLGGFYSIAGHGVPEKEAIRREKEFFGESYDRVLAATAHLASPDHEESRESGSKIAVEQKAVTAIFLKYPPKQQSNAMLLQGTMKKGHIAQAVSPIKVTRQLMDFVIGNVTKVLVVMTVLVIIVSGVSIFVSIYNSMSDRKREIAVMRALGAQRRTVFSIIIAESIVLCVLGGILGILLGHGLILLGAPQVAAATGLMIDPLTYHPAEIILLPAMVLLASLVGLLPALTAYKTDVARALVE